MPTLYAALAGTSTTSDLYTVDPTTGVMTSVGPMGFAVTGMATDPTSGILYGATSNKSTASPDALITIDTSSGAGTLVGDMGANAADICFDAAGQLYGWIEGPDDLATIDKATGTATVVGEAGINTFGDAMDFDSGGTLWVLPRGADDNYFTVDTSSGALTTAGTLDDPTGFGPAMAAGSFDVSDTFWVIANSSNSGPNKCWLTTVDLGTGTTTVIGEMTRFADGLAWGPGGTPAGFSLAFSPTSLNIFPGFSKTSTLTSTLLTGSDDTATLSYTAPSGITASFSASTINEDGGSVVVTVSVASSVAAGTYPVTVHGNDSDETRSRSISIVVSTVWCVNAVDDPNTSNPGVTVGANYVTDVQELDFSADVLIGDTDYKATMYVRGDNLPPPGQYTLKAHFLNSANPAMWVVLNGLPLWPISYLYSGASNTVDPFVTGRENNNSGPGPTYIPIAAGDVLEIVMAGDFAAQLNKVCFTQVTTTAGRRPGVLLGDAEILGATPSTDLASGDVNPDPTMACSQMDVAITDNGDVYACMFLWKFTANSHALVLKRWREGVGWTLISNNVWDLGYHYAVPNVQTLLSFVSMDTDGTDVYICFAQPDGTSVTIGGFPRNNYNWRVKKYHPATDSLSEIGSSGGQRSIVARTVVASNVGNEIESIKMRLGPDGKVWVAWSESLDEAGGGYQGNARPHLWYWSGSAWVNCDPPPPPDLTGVLKWTSENVADCVNVDIAFRHHDGPSNWPCVFYTVNYIYSPSPPARTLGNWIYSEFDGSSWSYTLQFFTDDVWPMAFARQGTGTLGVPFYDWWTQGFSLVDNGTDLLLFAAAGNTQNADRGVVGRLKPGGSHFGPVTPTPPTLDDFNRSENPLSTNWDRQASDGDTLKADGSKVITTQATGATGESRYNRTDLGVLTDAEVAFTLGRFDVQTITFGTVGRVGVYLRGSPQTSFGGFTGYELRITRGNFSGFAITDRMQLVSVDAGFGERNLLTKDFPNNTFAIGDSFCIQAIGHRFFMWRQPVSGAWTLVGTTSDWAHTSGRTGILIYDFGFTSNGGFIEFRGKVGIDGFAAQELIGIEFAGFESLSPNAGPTDAGEGYWSYQGDPFGPSSRWGGGWEFPSVTACSDAGGNLFCLFSSFGERLYGDFIVVNQEIGTADGWIAASKSHQPIGEGDPLLVNSIHFKDGYVYVSQVIASNLTSQDFLVVIRYRVIYAGGFHVWQRF